MEDASTESMSFGRLLKAGAITLAVSIACLLPPIVHFVTGPLGPAIGGYFGGSKARLLPGEAALLGLLLAVLGGVPILIGVYAFTSLNSVAAIFAAIFAAFYLGGLSGLAAWFGGSSSRDSEQQTTEEEF